MLRRYLRPKGAPSSFPPPPPAFLDSLRALLLLFLCTLSASSSYASLIERATDAHFSHLVRSRTDSSAATWYAPYASRRQGMYAVRTLAFAPRPFAPRPFFRLAATDSTRDGVEESPFKA